MHRAVDSEEGSTSKLAGPIRGEIPGRHGRLGGRSAEAAAAEVGGGRQESSKSEVGESESKVKMEGRKEEVTNN